MFLAGKIIMGIFKNVKPLKLAKSFLVNQVVQRTPLHKDRLRESSTWAGLVGLLGVLGVTVQPDMLAEIVSGMVALISVIFMVKKESSTSVQG